MAFHTTSLQKAVAEGIKRITLTENFVLHWSDKDMKILNIFLQEGVVSKDEVLALLHSRLKELGRNCYEEHRRGKYPDHTSSPPALAYSLSQGEFTAKEEQCIQFDHGETKETFIALYGEHLLGSVFGQLTR